MNKRQRKKKSNLKYKLSRTEKDMILTLKQAYAPILKDLLEKRLLEVIHDLDDYRDLSQRIAESMEVLHEVINSKGSCPICFEVYNYINEAYKKVIEFEDRNIKKST